MPGINSQHIEALGYIEQYLEGAVETNSDDIEPAYLWIDVNDLAEDLADGLNLTDAAALRLIAEMVAYGLLVHESRDCGLTTKGADALGYGHEYVVKK